MNRLSQLALIGIACLWPGVSFAIPITFNFTGQISNVDADIASGFTVGGTISGSYTFESTTPADGNIVIPYYNLFSNAITSFAINASGFNATGAGGQISVADNQAIAQGGQYQDKYSAFFAAAGATAPDINGYWFVGANLHAFTDFGPISAAITGTDLPLVPPALADFDTSIIQIHYRTQARQQNVLASLTSLTLAPPSTTPSVPDRPSTGILLAVTLFASLIGCRRVRPA